MIAWIGIGEQATEEATKAFDQENLKEIILPQVMTIKARIRAKANYPTTFSGRHFRRSWP